MWNVNSVSLDLTQVTESSLCKDKSQAINASKSIPFKA